LSSASFDVIVLGLGGMGSAAAYHLAGRGLRVAGVEQFTAAHDRGSSHGGSRIIRKAYWEDPAYVPLLLRAYELWRELDPALLRVTGGLMLSRVEEPVFAGALASARAHGLPHEVLDAAALRRRYPSLAVPDGLMGLYEADAGALLPEACVRAHLDGAARAGADVRFGARVAEWAPGWVRLADGEILRAPRLVIAAGAWARDLLGLPLRIERQWVMWVPPRAPDLPLFIWAVGAPAARDIYGLPDVTGEGFKVAFHHGGERIDPDAPRRPVSAEEIAALRAVLRTHIPALDAEPLAVSTCMYSNTADENFAIGLREPGVAVAAGFSGHGFKFCSVVGEILADLVCDGGTRWPIGPFALDRLA
jgi:sarcosine oxidase